MSNFITPGQTVTTVTPTTFKDGARIRYTDTEMRGEIRVRLAGRWYDPTRCLGRGWTSSDASDGYIAEFLRRGRAEEV